MPRLTKKPLGPLTHNAQEVGHFYMTVRFCCDFRHFQGSYLSELLRDDETDPHQTWLMCTKHHDDEKLSKARVFVYGRVRGGLANSDVSPSNRKWLVTPQ